jgi:hypothetical protein
LSKMCVATVVMEGMTGEVDAQEKLIGELAARSKVSSLAEPTASAATT